MEGPKELCERIENDVDKILKMYDFAAKHSLTRMYTVRDLRTNSNKEKIIQSS